MNEFSKDSNLNSNLSDLSVKIPHSRILTFQATPTYGIILSVMVMVVECTMLLRRHEVGYQLQTGYWDKPSLKINELTRDHAAAGVVRDLKG